MKRQMVQIPQEQVEKLNKLDKVRPDLDNYPISKKVHVLLQEKLAELLSHNFIIPKEEIEKGKWFEYIRELVPFHTTMPLALAVVRQSEEMIGKGFTKVLITNEGNKTWWCNYKKDIYSVGNYILSKLLDKNFSTSYYKKYEILYEDMKLLCEKIRRIDFSEYSNIALLNEYNLLYEKLKQFYALSMDIDAIDIVLEEIIKLKLSTYINDEKKLNESYNTIITPKILSYLNKEQFEIYELTSMVKNDERLLSLFDYDLDIIYNKIEENYPDFIKKLKKLKENYWWTPLGWTNRKIKTEKNFLTDIKNILKENPNLESEILRLKNHFDSISKKKEEIIIKYGFDLETQNYIEIFERYTLLHDYRKEIQMKGTNELNHFLFELSSRYSMKYDDLAWCFPSEIQKFIIDGNINLEHVRQRKNACYVLITRNNIEEIVGIDAITKRKKELEGDVKKLRDFKGSSASYGRVTGRAKVCYSAEEAIQKIEPGDILIASMTLPDFLPAMKKASAIVTDEGGITCHAAIVSRELGIPCVVGTKVATKVIEDNQMIEVNADHGVIKILGENK